MESGLGGEIAARLLAFAEQTADLVGVTDPWGRILYLNPAARKRLGFADDAADLTTGDVFPPEAFTLYYDVIRPHLLRTGEWSGEIPVRVAGANAVAMYVSITAERGPGGEINESVMYGHEAAPAEPVRWSDGSDVDEVTGLLHRAAFDRRARLVLSAASRDGEACALVLATVLDASEATGEFHTRIAATVMRALAGRMNRLARTTDVVGRVADDQLSILLRGVRTHNEALRAARTVYESLVDAPVTTPGEEITPSIRCGVGFAAPGDDLLDVLEEASAVRWSEPATGDASSEATGTVSPRIDAPTMEEFRIGMSHGDIRPYARPVVDLASGRLIGYQGLARWQHRRLGLLDAEVFADMIADTPLANQVDLNITREIAAVLTLTTRDTPLRLYAPVSRRLLADVRTEQYLCEIVDAFSLTTNQIGLELPRLLLDNWAVALRDALQSLREAAFPLVLTGLEIAEDVGRFADLGFGEVHLPRSMTSAAERDPDARRIVSEIVRRAHDRAVLVAATGVNDSRQRDVLVEAGCDFATGNLYGEPVPAITID